MRTSAHRRGQESHSLIIEDDILEQTDTDLFKAVQIFVNSTNPDYIDIAGGAGLNCEDDKSLHPNFVKIQPPRTRTNAGYIVSKSWRLLFKNFYLFASQ